MTKVTFSSNDHLQNFIQCIQDSGINPPETLIPDGKLHRFSSNGEKGDDAGWYILFNGTSPGGCFGCWRSGIKKNWHQKPEHRLTPKELAEYRAFLKSAQATHKADEIERHATAARNATTLWTSAAPAPDSHPYLIGKGITACGVRLYENELVIPVCDLDNTPNSLQFINPVGKKRFLSGGKISGNGFVIGNLDGASKVCLAEGFATGASVFTETGLPVVIAFNAGNLLPVAQALRQRYPKMTITICADDDHQTEGNPGLTKATEAAVKINGLLAVPLFGENRQKSDTDFNDMQQQLGLGSVRKVIEAAAVPAALPDSTNPQEKKCFPFDFGGGQFIVSSQGVVFIGQPDKNGVKPDPLWICSKITVEALTRDRSSNAWGRLLRWKDSDNVLHEWAMPMEILQGDSSEMRRELAELGVTIAPSKGARDLLTSFLQMYPVDVRARCVDKLGWHDELYVTTKEVIGQSSETLVFQNSHAIEPAFSRAGTAESWRDSLASMAVENSRLLFALSAAFAAPLLNLINEDSGGFNFKGSSSSGKSTILKVAASVWGNPDTYPRLWRATANGLEGLAALHNDGLLILDELGQIDPKEAGDVAYLLANGQGKTRASRNGTARPSASWRILFLSSGEVGITTHMATVGKQANAGQEIRLADIPADAGSGMGCFENIHGQPSPAAFALAIKEAAFKSYGAVGLQWLRYIIQDRANLPETISNAIKDFVSEVVPPGSEGQVTRVARRFGIVAVAGELATHYQLTGWSEGEATQGVKKCFADWLDGFGGIENREERAILDQVKRFFEAHGSSRFENPAISRDQHITSRAGFIRKNRNGNSEYLVLPEIFKTELCKGFEQKQVLAVLKDHKWLEPGSDGRSTQKPSISGFGTPRVYVINSNLWDAE